ncbi:ribonuclease E/G [Hyphomicrobium sp. NDB2Meth4]|uniref:Rne/Rng family ribonuclease n=1 Tax=Hyphomicrobium sp. NDB2Meth4 TaxID=1892846 RepID=UPI000931307C|nr:ribonuclease E/G [Hyphomicrobium sp. NDB2Meth4]
MSNNKMLIDATHPEETRVVVLRNGRVEEFDFESAARKLLRGNIYLAKVTRVEPSLQAAFVEYGGNRHGFLAFNEIHPDYYQIPMADRQALLDEEAAAEAEEEAAADAHAEALARRRAASKPSSSSEDDDASDNVDDIGSHEDDDDQHGDESEGDDDGDHHEHHTIAEAVVADERIVAEPHSHGHENGSDVAANENTVEGQSAEAAADSASASEGEEASVREVASTSPAPEQVSTGEDALEELPSRPRRRPRSYKIQEVIKRRQVILVQVVKEERGNKGAALTTYLSLAGRYTVLMPNTARGGGISRKITQPQDRKRLKAIAAELEVPEGMGLIIRTAGASRTSQEIKRDFEYLLRLWESVRDLTLQSQAPSLVYEEGNLIKRSIRDLYNKDVEEVVVAGGEAHREAKDFMRMLMPSHAKNVIQYQEPEPLFTRYQIERQLNAMFSPYVTLRSGGYLVINQTEALVAIDVNSGKATREFSIEETAYHTNLEAADEIARQLKLRDLAGLIVVDFIDMEEKRNNRAVERRLKEALRFDRARIQVGRISHFGLLEMSRQRLRTGVLEGSTSQCPHCQGTGIIRSTESVALAVLRGLEDAIMSGTRAPLTATTTPAVALYILNNKRPFINDMETRLGLPIIVTGSDKLAGANFTIEKGAAPAQLPRRIERNVVNMESGFEGEDEGGVYEVREAREPRDEAAPDHDGEQRSGEQGNGSRRRRRRRRGGRRDRDENGARFSDEGRGNVEDVPFDDEDGDGAVALANGHDHDHDHDHEAGHEHSAGEHTGEPNGQEEGERPRGRSRRRGRRGGRRGRERAERHGEMQAGEQSEDGAPEDDVQVAGLGEQPTIGENLPSYEVHSDAREPETPGHEEAIADFASLPADGNDDIPAKEVQREVAAPAPSAASDETIVEAEVADEPAAEEAPAPVRAARRRRTESSEPRLERIVVGRGDGEEAVTEEAAASAAPARKGWWQRKLGG